MRVLTTGGFFFFFLPNLLCIAKEETTTHGYLSNYEVTFYLEVTEFLEIKGKKREGMKK